MKTIYRKFLGGLAVSLLAHFGSVQAAVPVFFEDFSAATHGAVAGAIPNTSEIWVNTTTYYSDPIAAGWIFDAGVFLAVQDEVGDQAILLNEVPAAGTAFKTPDFAVVVGQEYTVSFDHWGDNRPLSDPYAFDVYLDDIVLLSVSRLFAIPGPGDTDSFNFTATKVLYSLTFQDATPDGNRASGIIDNVSVTAVPEPETYAMLLAGLGLMGFVARRRRKQVAA